MRHRRFSCMGVGRVLEAPKSSCFGSLWAGFLSSTTRPDGARGQASARRNPATPFRCKITGASGSSNGECCARVDARLTLAECHARVNVPARS